MTGEGPVHGDPRRYGIGPPNAPTEERTASVRDGGPAVEKRRAVRRQGARRAADSDMSNDDLRALIQAALKQVDDERRDRQRDLDDERAERRRETDKLEARLSTLEKRTDRVTVSLIRWGAFFAVTLGTLAWFGPTRLANLLKAVMSGP